MKKISKALVALVLCLSFVCNFIPATAVGEENLMEFKVENEEATLVNAGWDLTGHVDIPATYQGYPVTAIGAYAFSDECCIQSITIPHTVTSIHREAFSSFELQSFQVDPNNPAYSADSQGVLFNKDQTTLVRAPLPLSGSYQVPESVTVIEEYAFYSCFYLTQITLSQNLKKIGQRAFDACSRLTDMTLPESLDDIGLYAFSGCSKLPYATYGNETYLGTATNPYHALILTKDHNITTADVHPDTGIIAGAAFRGCLDLRSITIPEGVFSIGTWAFAGTSRLQEITLPSTLRFLGDDVFTEGGLTQIVIPEGVTAIGDRVFQDCPALTSITLPESLISIGENAFSQTALTQIRLGKNVSSIGTGAFSDCPNLTGIQVSADNAHYAADARGVLFNKAQTSLLYAPKVLAGEYQVPDGVQTIEANSFYRCTELTGITIPESVTTVGAYCFYNCDNLSQIQLPDQLQVLGAYAFAYCNALQNVTIPRNITSISEGLFYGSRIQTISLPQGLTCIEKYAFYNNKVIEQIQFPDSLTTIGDHAFQNCSELLSVHIPEGVTSIGNQAFYHCNKLVRVSVPNSICSMGSLAFSECQNLVYGYTLNFKGIYLGNEESPYLVLIGVTDDEVETLTLPSTTRVIADSALRSCNALNRITLPEGLVTIGNDSFYDCISLRSLTIPGTVTQIGDNAFAESRLTEITIPSSVEYIGKNAFENCKNLVTVRFGGALPVIKIYAFHGVTANIYCHREGNESRMLQYGGNLTWLEGHVYGNYLPDAGFDCTTGGTKSAQCEGCDQQITITVTEPSQHRFELGVCQVCGAFDGQNCYLTGSLTSSGDSQTLLTLSQNGVQISTLTVDGNDYLWDSLQPGDYTLMVSKANHVTYSTGLSIASGENKLNLTLCRPGDVVGIGDLNIGDVARIYSHIKTTSVLTGYALACADVNGNGTINVGDTAMLYAKLRGN